MKIQNDTKHASVKCSCCILISLFRTKLCGKLDSEYAGDLKIYCIILLI